MHNTKEIERLEEQQREIESRINVYATWLVNNFDNPMRGKIVQDKNALGVKLHTIKYKIENLKTGLPILGYNEELEIYVKITEHKRTPSN